jgi:hypothetical protein
MYVESVPNRTSPPAVLLRESRREDGKIVKRTLANLSDWPAAKIESLRRLLRDELLVDPHALFQTHQTLPHGHVEAVLMTMQRLGVESILASQPGRERDLVMAMIAERILHPCSKLETVRDWHTTTLAEQLSVQDATQDELYLAMDWLLGRKQRIEKKLAARHLKEGSFVLYDVSSNYYEGHCCPLANFGYGRDGKKGLPIIVYGVLTDPQGRPLAVEVYPGNTADPTTVIDQANKLADQFGLSQVVFVADRGMLTQPQIEKLKTHAGFGWVTALTSVAIRELVADNSLQLSLLDETNLAEITSPDYPEERLMVCRNPLLADERALKRRELLESTEKIGQDQQTSGAAHEQAYAGFKVDQGNSRVFLPKLGWIRYRNSRDVVGTVRSITVKGRHGKWLVSILTSRVVKQPVAQGDAGGIDLGVARFATLSDGAIVPPMNLFKRYAGAIC